MTDQEAVDAFHRVYYESAERTLYNIQWLGVDAQKYPTDLWVYQEIIFELRPDFIVETGTYWGGSALFLASICDLIGHGQVITIDVRPIAESPTTCPAHPRITYVEGSSIAPHVVEQVRSAIGDAATVMVILDSDHGSEHVVNELKVWADVVTDGSYLIVEDSNVNGHPVYPEFGPGPMEAMELFLTTNADFAPDRSREKFLLTANPKGFLKKARGGAVAARLVAAEAELDGLRGERAELAGLRQELDGLRKECVELDGLREQVAALREQLAGLHAELCLLYTSPSPRDS